MKAQRIRRSLWIANLLVGAGVVAVGAWAVLYKAPSVQAETAWAEKAVQTYLGRKPEAILQPAVDVQDLQSVFLNEAWKERWFPFTGPRIPPKAEPIKVDVEAPKGPTGLEAIGRVRMLLYRPAAAGGSIVFWEFPDKKSDEFLPGDFIAQKGQAGRFKLVDVVRIDAGRSRWRILYEVYDDPKGKPTSQGELIYDTEPKLDPKGPIRPSKKPSQDGDGAGGTAPGAPGTPGKPEVVRPGGPSAPVAPSPVTVVGGDRPAGAWKPTVRDLGRGRREITLDDDAFAALKDTSVEKLIEDVRTEPYDKGGVRGLQVFPTGAGAVADKFDVRRGDILISINGQPVATRDDAIRVARGVPPDTARVSVVIDRDGERLTYEVDPRDPKTRRAAASVAPR
jgi:hypothetical protein